MFRIRAIATVLLLSMFMATPVLAADGDRDEFPENRKPSTPQMAEDR